MVNFIDFRVFRGDPVTHPEMVQHVGVLMQCSYRAHGTVQHLKKFPGWAFTLWSYSDANMRTRTVTRVRTVVLRACTLTYKLETGHSYTECFHCMISGPESNLRRMVTGVQVSPIFTEAT